MQWVSDLFKNIIIVMNAELTPTTHFILAGLNQIILKLTFVYF